MDAQLHEIITPELLAHIRKTYQLRWEGIHGWAHWMRVYENGMFMAQRNGANQAVVALFAFTHDMARQSDGRDHDHGPRAARLIQSDLQGKFFHLPAAELTLLVQAVDLHTRGLTQADITVQTCWDSDRLDLGRAGYHPSPERLCTDVARDPKTIAWAYERSIHGRS